MKSSKRMEMFYCIPKRNRFVKTELRKHKRLGIILTPSISNPGWDQYKKGFTLIEILLVVIILGILVAMIAPSLFGRGEQARISAARADIEANLSTALDLYELDNGYYPSTEQGLRALNEKPSSAPVPGSWNGPYLKRKKEPLDPWKREYKYSYPGAHNTQEYDLSSLGPDGIESNDDVVNWDTQ